MELSGLKEFEGLREESISNLQCNDKCTYSQPMGDLALAGATTVSPWKLHGKYIAIMYACTNCKGQIKGLSLI